MLLVGGEGPFALTLILRAGRESDSSESMRNTPHAHRNFNAVVDQLGGPERLEAEARATKAFQRPREVKCAVDMLQIVLAYCLGPEGLRLTAAWAEAVGIAAISNVAVLQRVRNCVPWLEALVARMLLATEPRQPRRLPVTGDRLIRIVDATVLAKADRVSRDAGGVWRVHAVLDLNDERFSVFELTDEKEGERLDRAAVIPGEIRIGDRAYLQPDRIAKVLAAGGDVVIRAPCGGARWLDADGELVDLPTLLALTERSVDTIDRPIWMGLSGTAGARPEPRVAVRLVALRKPPEATKKSLEKVFAEAKRRGSELQPGTIIAAEWLILITSLPAAEFPAMVVGDLYRLRWRIETAFKHLKSGIGLTAPPGPDPRAAKAHILSALLASLLTEPHLRGHLGNSPRRAVA